MYRQYSNTPGLLDLEAQAKALKLGLWGVSQKPIAPWEWRKSKRQK